MKSALQEKSKINCAGSGEVSEPSPVMPKNEEMFSRRRGEDNYYIGSLLLELEGTPQRSISSSVNKGTIPVWLDSSSLVLSLQINWSL